MKDLDIKKIQPTRGYVLVEPAKTAEKTASGIILPENDSEKPQHGVVLAVGEADCTCGCYECNCEKETSKKTKKAVAFSVPVVVGDKVIYKKWGGNEFKIGETEYQFLKFEDVLAIIK
jgi:chaperonin GroES